jgi:farnesyl-diphosphate farnesyltransferase
MREFVARSDERGALQITTLDDLHRYCYVVAGIVVELLTALFLHDEPRLEVERDTLVAYQGSFGEGLQLVNILKNAAEDERDGRVYIPKRATRAQLIGIAREDLLRASLYTAALVRSGAPNGYVAFTSVPHELAILTLDLVEREDGEAKVPRGKVLSMFESYLAFANA